MNKAISVCKICEEEFEPKGRRKSFCGKDHYRPCEECNSEYFVKPVVNPPRFCSASCAATHRNRAQSAKIKKCLICGDDFSPTNSNSKYCTKDHLAECEHCGKEYVLQPTKPKKYCSQKCSINHEDKKKNCTLCGEVFLGSSNQLYCKNTHYTSCETCGNSIANSNPKKLSKYCSASCSSNDPKRAKPVKCEICGESFLANVPWAKFCNREHKKDCSVCEKSFLILNKYLIPDTCSPVCAAALIDFSERNAKSTATLMDRYGVSNPYQLPQVIENMKLNLGYRVSKLNLRWKEKLDNLGVNFELEQKFGNASYCDLAHKNILVDINPSISHSSSHNFLHMIGRCTKDPESCKCKPKNNLYHQLRFLEAEAEGKTLLQHFDWYDAEIFESVVRSKLHRDENRVAAKRCEIREISQRDANRFFKENHLLGATKGQTFCVGLFYEGELVHAHSYGPARLNKKYQWEAIRSCSKMNWQVQGAFSRADKLFFKTVDPDSVISYVDLALGRGETESNNPDWKLISTNRPSATWVFMGSDAERGNKPPFVKDASARKVSADRLLGFEVGEKYPTLKSDGSKFTNEDVLMAEGYTRIHDVGTRTFGWRRGS